MNSLIRVGRRAHPPVQRLQAFKTLQNHLLTALVALSSVAACDALAPKRALALSDLDSGPTSITYDGETFPSKVLLTEQFSGPVRNQGQMGSCHVFSATAIAEAYCNQLARTPAPAPTASGTKPAPIRMSEYYLFYRHLRTELSGRADLPSVEAGTLFGDVDAGYPAQTLQRIFNGSVLSEKELPVDGALELSAKLARAEAGETNRAQLARAAETLDGYFKDAAARASLKLTASSEGGYAAKTQNAAILRCLARPAPEVRREVFYFKRVLRLLKQGTPVIWSGMWMFAGAKTAVSHAVIIDGYRWNEELFKKDPKAYPLSIEFHVRNSAVPSDGWISFANERRGDIVYLSRARVVRDPDARRPGWL